MHDVEDDIWQSQSLKFLEMAFRTDHQEKVTHADGHGRKSRECGDTLDFFLILQQDRIETISYCLQGCLNTNACANAVIEMVQGKRLDEAWEIKPQDVSGYLQSLPADHFHCAELAVDALRLTLADAREKLKSPWKKLYN